MFSPEMYQLQTDHLPPLPSLIIATNQDVQSTLTYEPNHQYLHDQQYELFNSRRICESPPSSCYVVLADESNKPITSGGLTQRSVSSHSLPPQMNDNNNRRRNMAFNYKPASNAINLGRTHRLLDLIDSSSVRRVLSTGDLQVQMQQYQLSQQQQQHGLSSPKESSSSSIIEGMLSQACRYSPEEKRERIERYKTKRSHRNFNKKIKYACRKTLADSRPRIKGRFARNNNNEDDKWGGNREDETGDQRENNEDNNWFDLLFNAAWLLE